MMLFEMPYCMHIGLGFRLDLGFICSKWLCRTHASTWNILLLTLSVLHMLLTVIK